VDHKNPKSIKHGAFWHHAFWARLLPALALSISTLTAVGPARAERDAAQDSCPETAVGATLENATVQNAEKQPAQIPGFGEKILLILYTDPDVADQNDTFADAVKAQGLDRNVFQSIGIANMEDAPAKPNWIIRAIVRSKIKKYNVTILTDSDRSLPRQWKLCGCDDKSVVLVVGKDKKLKYFKKGKLDPNETNKVIDLLKKEIAAAGGSAGGATQATPPPPVPVVPAT
jgi:predicted transcriptional regulator